MNELKQVDKITLNNGDTYNLFQCTICNAMFIGKNKILTGCSICNNHRYDMNNLEELSEEYKAIASGQYKKEGYKYMANIIKMQPSIYWKKVGILENEHSKGKKSIISCTRCDFYKVVDVDEELNNVVCNKCKNKLSQENIAKTLAEWEKLNNSYNKEQENIARKQLNDVKYAESRKQTYKEIEDEANTDKLIVKHKQMLINKKLSEIKSPYIVTNLYKQGGVTNVQLACTKCGSIDELSTPSTRAVLNYKCRGCEIHNKKDPKYLGILKRKLEGTVKNGLYVVNTDKNTVTLQCNYCGETFNDIPKIDFINKNVYCDCKYSLCILNCKVCKKELTVSISDVIKNKDIICPNCDSKQPRNEYLNYITEMDKLTEIRRSLSPLKKASPRAICDIINNIAKSKNVLYVDNEGHQYFNCRCLEHNQSIILRNDNIENYDHTLCNSEYNFSLSNEEIDKVRFTRKRRTE